jgi:hypothetical protein
MDKSDAVDGPSNSQSVLNSLIGHYPGVFLAFDWHFLLLHGRYKIYIMIPIDLESFSNAPPFVLRKKGKGKRLIPRTEFRSSLRLGKGFEGLGINTETMDDSANAG